MVRQLKRYELGFTHTWLFCDATGHPAISSPVQDVSAPIHLGLGPTPPVAGETFVHDALLYRARSVLTADDHLNPFNVPFIMAELV